MIMVILYSFCVTVQQGSSLSSVKNDREALFAVAVTGNQLIALEK